MASNPKNILNTIIAWNSKTIVIRHISGTKNETNYFLAKIHKFLNHKNNDPRWQLVSGHLNSADSHIFIKMAAGSILREN